MHEMKICALLLLTLGVMRVVSWAVAWMMAQMSPVRIRPIVIASNVAGFGLFALLLWWNSMPGEGLDIPALLFALVVFGIYGISDMYWRPWGRTAKVRADRSKVG
jgi:hypothetical protein